MDLNDLEHNVRDGVHIASLREPGQRWLQDLGACVSMTNCSPSPPGYQTGLDGLPSISFFATAACVLK